MENHQMHTSFKILQIVVAVFEYKYVCKFICYVNMYWLFINWCLNCISTTEYNINNKQFKCLEANCCMYVLLFACMCVCVCNISFPFKVVLNYNLRVHQQFFCQSLSWKSQGKFFLKILLNCIISLLILC